MSNQDWNRTANRFVAFFDIMGFKDLVQRNSHDNILKRLETLKNVLKKLENSHSENNKTLKKLMTEKFQTRSITFSDSIIIFSKSDTIKDFDKLVLDSYSIIHKALENGIGIKGALSYGEITVDFENYLFFGQPIIDAYLLHDELLLYTAVLDNNIEAKQKTLGKHHLPESIIIDYKLPFKSGRIKHKLIKSTNKQTDSAIFHLEKIYSTVSGKPRLYIDNTIEFLRTNRNDA